jgi:hypothetical protein
MYSLFLEYVRAFLQGNARGSHRISPLVGGANSLFDFVSAGIPFPVDTLYI